MSYLKFNKQELVNLEYSLEREILLCNRAGGYVNTTIVGCNTRKYHGLLVVPINHFGGEKHILLSTLHESLIQHEKSFNLGINSYGKVYNPKGHKYIVDFEMDYASTITYQVGGMKLSKTLFFARSSEELLVKYTLLEAHSPTTLRIKPFLAFRNIHALTNANPEACTKFTKIEGGVAFRMYKDFPQLNMQTSKKADWIACPDWYYGVTYKEESRRGFADKEDLFVPGYFEMPIKRGESIILSVSTEKIDYRELKERFDAEMIKKDGSRSSYDACLKLAAKQFVIKQNENYSICSGYTWDYEDLRYTFISAAGLTLYNGDDEQKFKNVIDNAIAKIDDAIDQGEEPDVPLWFVRSLQQHITYGASEECVWKRYGKVVKEYLRRYLDGEINYITLHENGLLWAKKEGSALSWMNAYCEGKPVTERAGYQVEMNALWYNALCFAIKMTKRDENLQRWKETVKRIENNFMSYFWVPERNHLADYVDEAGKNIFMRPNQLLACCLDFSPINDEHKMLILSGVKRELLTIRGIRTLSPKNPLYKGVYEGDQRARDNAHHNGCAFPFILGMYIDSQLKLVGKTFKEKGLELVNAFEEDISIHGIGSIAELYDGDPSHKPHGCISSAVSVSEIIRIKNILNHIKSRR